MNHRTQPLQSHLFTVRLWLERVGRDQFEWRGQAQHVLSGKTRYFRDWSALIEFLTTTLSDTQGDEHVEERPEKGRDNR